MRAKRELVAQTALGEARARLDAVFTQLREVESGAAEAAARKAERRVQAENLRLEAERLDREAQAARERLTQSEIAAGAATHRHGELRRELGRVEQQSLEGRGRIEDAEREVAARARGSGARVDAASRSIRRG